MDDEDIWDILTMDAVDLDAIVQVMGNLAAILMSTLEDGEDAGVVYWHTVSIDMDDFLTMGDPSFRLHFRMTRATFEELVIVVGNHLVQTYRMRRERTPLPYILMMVLWILATPDSFRSVALQFGVRPGTVHFHYLYIIQVLRELAPRYISWPDAEERAQISRRFEEATGFPGVIGCLDGTHHPIIGPRQNRQRYVNRHHSYSMNTQCVCDDRLLVRDIYIGEVGSVHDSRIFRRSPLCAKLLENEDMIDMDQHILGDGGYVLTDSVLTPFRNNGRLSPAQRNYNRIHAQARVRIENCFGRCKMMWRRSQFLYAVHQEVVIDHLVATFMVHNFVILSGEELMNFEELCEPVGEDEDYQEEDEEDENLNYPEVANDPDPRGLEDAKERGVEKRLHVIRNLPRLYD